MQLEHYRVELTGYCYRMLGSSFDADDAVQDTLVRAWQSLDRFEGRSSLRSWLYRIATNVCLDVLRAKQRRAMPMDMSQPVPSSTPPGQPLPEATWIQPIADADVVPVDGDPAARAVLQDSIRLAFVAALQHLPARQRAVLILREVLAWPAADVAELLDTTVASVNSALQRARATLGTSGLTDTSRAQPLSEEDRALLSGYVEAFERYDMKGLVSLLHEDASMSMPPLSLWLRGREDMLGWYVGHGSGCRGSRLVPLAANGSPAYAQYHPTPDGHYKPWCIQVLELAGGRISHIHHFLGEQHFARFGLPLTLE
ncbi:MAG: sigma-70 family RNA polymerase sigma factor [Actinomycetota bacterium]|nr:sigma-70 family RNA polymerase sigma factor [Actinomycetota bacterium]